MQLFQKFLDKVFVFNDRLKIVFDPLGSGKNEVTWQARATVFA